MSNFQTVFFVFQIRDFLISLSKKNLKKINLRVRFLPLKIAFFEGFENNNIFSSKSYTVKKSGISPQCKLGFLRNFKHKFIRYKLITPCITLSLFDVTLQQSMYGIFFNTQTDK